MKKRTYALLLTALLISMTVSSCAEEKQPEAESAPEGETVTETAAPETEDPTRYAAPEVKDLGGFTLNVATSSWINCDKMFLPDTMTGEVVDDTIFETVSQIQDKYNASIHLQKFNSFQEVTDAVYQSVMGGDNEFGLSYNHDSQTVSNAMKNVFLNLRDAKNIDFDAPWWTETADSFTIGGKQFFASNHMTYSGIYLAFGLCYNKTLAAALDITIPYEDIAAGNWYMNDMIAMAKASYADLNGDDKMEIGSDRYGFVSSAQGLINLQHSFGQSVFAKDEGGMLTYGLDGDLFIKELTAFEDLMESGYWNKKEDDGRYGGTEFAQGNVLFDYLQIRIIPEYLRQSKVEFGFIPLPKLDETQKEYFTSAYDVFWGIPKTASGDVDSITLLTEAMGYNCYYNILPLVYESTLKTKLSESPEDAATFDILRDTIHVDAGYAFIEQNSWSMWGIVAGFSQITSGNAASRIESSKNSVDGVVKLVNQFYSEAE